MITSTSLLVVLLAVAVVMHAHAQFDGRLVVRQVAVASQVRVGRVSVVAWTYRPGRHYLRVRIG